MAGTFNRLIRCWWILALVGCAFSLSDQSTGQPAWGESTLAKQGEGDPLELAPEDFFPAIEDALAEPRAQAIELEPLGDSTETEGAEEQHDFSPEYGAYAGTGLEGRSLAAREHLVEERGGTEESEAAVAAALEWLAEQQNEDGSWSYQFPAEGEEGHCANGGTLEGRNSPTGLALLAFLAAGHTHLQGDYKSTVKDGLDFLLRNIQVTGDRGSLTDDSGMTSQGICTIALCEAYALTQDGGLNRPTQLAINQVVFAQDQVGGGWANEPREAGNTQVTAWQLMALKAGHLAYLDVPGTAIVGASNFLDSAQYDDGARYGFNSDQAEPDQTAPGLLMRMHLGWERDHPELERGVDFLAQHEPSQKNPLSNYYSTQVLFNSGGNAWEVWNPTMRDMLTQSQAREGHEAGSWYFGGDEEGPTLDVGEGGRLYCTVLACLTLEVYYRQQPLYGNQASEEDFPY